MATDNTALVPGKAISIHSVISTIEASMYCIRTSSNERTCFIPEAKRDWRDKSTSIMRYIAYLPSRENANFTTRNNKVPTSIRTAEIFNVPLDLIRMGNSGFHRAGGISRRMGGSSRCHWGPGLGMRNGTTRAWVIEFITARKLTLMIEARKQT